MSLSPFCSRGTKWDSDWLPRCAGYEEIGRLWEEGTRSTEGLKGKLVEKLVDLNPKDKNYELCAAQVRHFDMVMELDE